MEKLNYLNVDIVSNKKTSEEGLEKIIAELKELGYQVFHKILNTKDYGIPQNRERVFIICSYKNNINFDKLKYVNNNVKSFLFPKRSVA